MNVSNCPMWDEYHHCCIWERMEKIFCFPWEEKEKGSEVNRDCFEEMP